MAFGVYVHIPYCLQRCSYCDFATFEWNQIIPPEKYIELVKKEIRDRSPLVHKATSQKKVDTVYFGGGTPSLIDAEHIVAVLDELAKQGFEISSDAEVTIEINPATIDPEKLKTYLAAGVNRFSVGAQTFNDQLLKAAGRKHSAQDTIQTLDLLNRHQVDFSFDLLFALPNQSLSMLKIDLEMLHRFQPAHLSAYCLTVPESHPMQKGRAPEEEQIEMFQLIESELQSHGLHIYEISNFARAGKESRHNMLYWTDENYWGVGLSAHSYFKSSTEEGRFGVRFWNPNTIESYQKSLSESVFLKDHCEHLLEHQSLTDYCHTFLRLTERGLSLPALQQKFSRSWHSPVEQRLNHLVSLQLLEHRPGSQSYRLSAQSRVLSNRIFEDLTFLATDCSV